MRAQGDVERAWPRFARRYRAEMNAPDAARLLDALAVLSHGAKFAVGCYCADSEGSGWAEFERQPPPRSFAALRMTRGELEQALIGLPDGGFEPGRIVRWEVRRY